MADLSIDFAGIKSPNPFWLASAPPANTGDQVMRAFDAGWGGAVWKTLGNPIVNVSSRFWAVDYGNTRMMGLNNIELITDRPLEVNLREPLAQGVTRNTREPNRPEEVRPAFERAADALLAQYRQLQAEAAARE